MLILTKQDLLDEIKVAMKAQDKTRLAILRQVHGELKNIEVNERREVTEEDVSAMMKRTLKQTKETYDGSVKAGTNAERTELLGAQIEILEAYLPQQLAGAELEALVKQIITDNGFATKREMGQVMGALTNQTGGNFDKAAAAKIAGTLLG